jgi:hypothetical protein
VMTIPDYGEPALKDTRYGSAGSKLLYPLSLEFLRELMASDPGRGVKTLPHKRSRSRFYQTSIAASGFHHRDSSLPTFDLMRFPVTHMIIAVMFRAVESQAETT